MQILIIDLGSQYSMIIDRALREMGYRAALLEPDKAKKWLKQNQPKAIILSGGSASVYDQNAPVPPINIFKQKIPVLGICYGMQWLVHSMGGKVFSISNNKEYGATKITVNKPNPLFNKTKKNLTVWSSHGDSIEKLPTNFEIIATSANKTIEAIAYPQKKLWGIQFHPEVTHSEQGKKILENFLEQIADCQKDWQPQNTILAIQKETIQALENKKAIIGFSGGVDSTVLSAILASKLKDKLLAIAIDTGALRQNELTEIKQNAKSAGINLKIILAAKKFQKTLGKAIDAEKKRIAFKKTYVKILEQAAQKFGADFIIQGSLATDYIESGKQGKATLIKSHHNIGNKWKLRELHPLRNLFKQEVRALGKTLKLPKRIVFRQPFPGPGLFIRVVGTPSTIDKLNILKIADQQVTAILKKHKLYQKFSQVIVALIGVKTVGIKGDKRSYSYPLVIRIVKTKDFMTALGIDLPTKIKKEIEKAVTTHPQINRVWFDITDKPPATTEME